MPNRQPSTRRSTSRTAPVKKRAIVKQISCSDALAQVFDFIDGHIGAAPRREIEKHLDVCRHCYARFEFERLLKNRVRESSPVHASIRLRERVQRVLERY